VRGALEDGFKRRGGRRDFFFLGRKTDMPENFALPPLFPPPFPPPLLALIKRPDGRGDEKKRGRTEERRGWGEVCFFFGKEEELPFDNL